MFPVETVLYYLDEILFSGYKKVVIKEPFLILGQPRSGTTKFESILEGDEDFVCMKMWECRFPYLSYQYAVDLVCHVDGRYLNGSIEKFVRDYRLLDGFDEGVNAERPQMRRVRYDLSDEDDTIFLFHFLVHFQLMGAFPDPEVTSYLHHFDNLSALERRRMLHFHRRAVQKLMYRRGKGKRYFAKWVLSWCGVVQQAFDVYPDMKMLVMTRGADEQLRSWFKLQSLLCIDLTGHNMFEDNPEVLKELKVINAEFYRNEVNFLSGLDQSRRLIFNSADFYKDIQNNTRNVYRFLGKEIAPGSKFEKFLMEQTQQQLNHKATTTDDRYITDEEIKRDFIDLPAVLAKLDQKKTE